jgi:DNA-binding Xre family transcriptional regulator
LPDFFQVSASASASIKGCRLETLVKIADALGCLVDDLFDK